MNLVGGAPAGLLRQAHGLMIVALAIVATFGLRAQDTYDVVIANGRVIDPESGLDATRNVGIGGGVIRAISADRLNGRTTVDASGLVVAPGFIRSCPRSGSNAACPR